MHACSNNNFNFPLRNCEHSDLRKDSSSSCDIYKLLVANGPFLDVTIFPCVGYYDIEHKSVFAPIFRTNSAHKSSITWINTHLT